MARSWASRLETLGWSVNVLRPKDTGGRERVIVHGIGPWPAQVVIVLAKRAGRDKWPSEFRRYYAAKGRGGSKSWASLTLDQLETFASSPKEADHAGIPSNEITQRVRSLISKAESAPCRCQKRGFSRLGVVTFIDTMRTQPDGSQDQVELRADRCPEVPGRWHTTTQPRTARITPAVEEQALQLETLRWATNILRLKTPGGREQIIVHGTGPWPGQVAVVFTRKNRRWLPALRRYYVTGGSEGWAALSHDDFETFATKPRRRHAGTPDDETTQRVLQLLENAQQAPCGCRKLGYTRWSAKTFLERVRERRERGKDHRHENGAYRCPEIPARWHITSQGQDMTSAAEP